MRSGYGLPGVSLPQQSSRSNPLVSTSPKNNLPRITTQLPRNNEVGATLQSPGSRGSFTPSSRAATNLFPPRSLASPSSIICIPAPSPTASYESVLVEVGDEKLVVKEMNLKLFKELTANKSEKEIEQMVRALQDLEIKPKQTPTPMQQKGFI